MPQVFEIRDISSILLDKPAKIISLKASDHQGPNIQAELKSAVDPASSLQADVVQKGVGVYNITCTPYVRDEMEGARATSSVALLKVPSLMQQRRQSEPQAQTIGMNFWMHSSNDRFYHSSCMRCS